MVARLVVGSLIAGLALVMAAPVARAQSASDNPRYGAWKLKPANPYPEGSKQSNIMTYDPLPGGGIRVKIETTNAAGEKGTPWGYDTMLDGKDMPVTGRRGTDTAAVMVLNDKINLIIYKQGGKLVQVLQNVLSADNNTLNISYTSTNAQGVTNTTYAVYERIR
jgi:hypothetical protein